MRRILFIISLLAQVAFLPAQQQFIVWSNQIDQIELMSSNLVKEQTPNSVLLKLGQPNGVVFKNNSTSAVALNILWLNAKKETGVLNLQAGEEQDLEQLLLQKGQEVEAEDVWEMITAFYVNNERNVKAEKRAYSSPEAPRLSFQPKELEGLRFNKPSWFEINSPQDLDIQWTSRFAVKQVKLQDVTKGTNVFNVDGLGYYRLHYPRLDVEIQDKLLRNSIYELEVTVLDDKGQLQSANLRFSIKKALMFDVNVEKDFAREELSFAWESFYPVMEVMIFDVEKEEPVYQLTDPSAINGQHLKVAYTENTGAFGLDFMDLDMDQSKIRRGYEYDLTVAVRDEKGAKKLYSKRYYCKSTEETFLTLFKDDRNAYNQLMDFASEVQFDYTSGVVKTESAPDPSANLSMQPEVVEEDIPVKTEENISYGNPVEVAEAEEVVAEVEGLDPILHYSFDNSVIQNQSGNQFNAFGSSLVQDRNGNPNRAYRFDGQRDFISIPPNEAFSFTELTPFTLGFWFKSDASDATLGQFFTNKDQEGSFFLDIKIENNQAVVWCCAKGESCETLYGKKLESSKWQHLAVVYDEYQNMALYINGELVRNRSITISTSNKVNQGLLFGKDMNEKSYLQGSMDDIYLYKRALTEMEIKKLADY
ncbi:MAG: LamG domain-containing protein [Bacteroidota bacterium]